MTATREHLAGLELALNRWNDGGPAIQYGKLLSELIAEAQSAPEPVEGEAVACWIKSSVPGADIVVLGNPTDIHQAATDTKIPLYTASAKPDAELVTLLTELRLRVPLPDWARIRIDAKLSAYRA